MKTSEVVRALVEQPISQLGCELVDIEFQKEQGNWVLTLFIEKEGGVNIEDCERVSRAVEPIIDEADPIEQSYYLSVSSPGLDRPLKNERDFLRHIGKDVLVKLYVKQDDKKEFIGTLLTYKEGSITLACRDNKEREFPLKGVAQVKPYIEF